jgi:hypothetical protein
MYIYSPKSRKKIFLDNNISDYNERLEEVQQKVFLHNDGEIIEYCADNNKIKNKSQILSYQNAENLLDKLGTYLLMGQFAENNILTLHKIRQGYEHEIQASNSDSNAMDVMYGIQEGDKEVSITASPVLDKNMQIEKPIEKMSVQEIAQKEKKDKKATIKYKQSKTYRMNQLHSTREIRTYRVKSDYVRDEFGDVVLFDGKPKVAKNVFGQPILVAETTTIGGHKGLVGLDEKHVVNWCIVDTTNVFTFNGQKFKIDPILEQYRVCEDNVCEMEKILCYYLIEKEEYVFFDEKVHPIESEMITKVQ